MQTMGKRRYLAAVETGQCVACGCCVRVCPRAAIEVFHGMWARVDAGRCVGCGKCAAQCPAGVITLEEVVR